MGDLRDPRLMYLKGALFLVCGALCGTLLIMEAPTLKIAALLALTVWCFSRAYYFAFYVVQHWIDPAYRFSGLFDFAKYLLTKRKS